MTRNSGRRRQRRPQDGSWQELAQCVVLARTMPTVPGELCAALMAVLPRGLSELLILRRGKGIFGVVLSSFSIRRSTIFGALVMLQDVTSEVVSLWAMAFYLGGVGLAIAVLFFLFFYLYIARLDRRLATNQANLRETIARKDVALSHTSTCSSKTLPGAKRWSASFRGSADRIS